MNYLSRIHREEVSQAQLEEVYLPTFSSGCGFEGMEESCPPA